ncbi:MAG: aspartate/glutamate racemase family protein [Vampirovibrionales bacterium]|nr:aspartate/glutamate racemase family protein [Vampirovibrionales bacterium]
MNGHHNKNQLKNQAGTLSETDKGPGKPMRIGVFDSGIGGLSVLRYLLADCPHLEVVYLADTAWMPYGDKPLDQIATRAAQMLCWLADSQSLDSIVVACNTAASSLGLMDAELCKLQGAPVSQHAARDKILATGVKLFEPIAPTCHWLVKTVAPGTRVGLLATQATFEAQRYTRMLSQLKAPFEAKSVGCPGLATLIEQDHMQSQHRAAFDAALTQFLKPLLDWPLEALVLGCTHYPIAAAQIATHLPEHVKLIDPAHSLREAFLDACPLLPVKRNEQEEPPLNIWVTGSAEKFEERLQAMSIQRYLATRRVLKIAPVNIDPA